MTAEVVEPRVPVFCRAHSKQTLERCRRRVRIEGELCRWHGGKTPVVAARQELSRALGRELPKTSSDPAETLRQLLAVTEQVVGQLTVVLQDPGMAPAAELDRAGVWLDRLGRFAKDVVAMRAVYTGLSERQGEALVLLLERVARDLGHDPLDHDVRRVCFQALSEMGSSMESMGQSL